MKPQFYCALSIIVFGYFTAFGMQTIDDLGIHENLNIDAKLTEIFQESIEDGKEFFLLALTEKCITTESVAKSIGNINPVLLRLMLEELRPFLNTDYSTVAIHDPNKSDDAPRSLNPPQIAHKNLATIIEILNDIEKRAPRTATALPPQSFFTPFLHNCLPTAIVCAVVVGALTFFWMRPSLQSHTASEEE